MAGSRRPAPATVAWWLVYVGVYLSFVTFTWTQAVAGAAVAAVAVAVSVRALRIAGVAMPATWPRVWRLRAVAVILGREVRAVVAALVRQLLGRGRVSGRFVAVRVDEPMDVGLDVAVTVEASLAPNTYVVAAFPSDGLLLLHQFEPVSGARRSFPRWRR